MEGEKELKAKEAGQPKLSNEELNQRFMDLGIQYQKLMAEYRKAVDALNSQDFTAFFLQMAFKVIEHPNRYNASFVGWCASNIENLLKALGNELNRAATEGIQPEPENKKQDESK